jgi:hypothetical protein
MTPTFLKPTVVQHLRSFLAESGLGLAPTAGLGETLGALFGLFRSRKEDRAFWQQLHGLLHELGEARAGMPWGHGLPTPAAEIVEPAQLAGIIEELRSALAGNGKGRTPSWSAWLSRLGAPAACCVLLLGLATGCGSAQDGTRTAGESAAPRSPVATALATTPGPTGDAAVVASAPAAPTQAAATPSAVTSSAAAAPAPSATSPAPAPSATAAPEPARTMVDIVHQSNLPARIKGNLKRCLLGAYEQQERENLVDLFRKKSPEEVAQALEQMAQSERCNPYFGRAKPGPSQIEVLYKGISFPVR